MTDDLLKHLELAAKGLVPYPRVEFYANLETDGRWVLLDGRKLGVLEARRLADRLYEACDRLDAIKESHSA